MAQQIDFGKLAVTYGGDYNATTTYEKLTIVRYNNSSWISLKTTTGNAPSTDSVYWGLFLKDGDRGTQAEQSMGTMTLQTKRWTGSAVPYVYDMSEQLKLALGDDYDEKSKISVMLDRDNATSEQVTAYDDGIVCGDNTQKVYAYSSKPSVDLPVILTIKSGTVKESVVSE